MSTFVEHCALLFTGSVKKRHGADTMTILFCSWGSAMKMLSCFSRVQLFATPWTVAARLLCPWDSPGKNTGVGWCAFHQGIFLTQGWNL